MILILLSIGHLRPVVEMTVNLHYKSIILCIYNVLVVTKEVVEVVIV